MALFDERLLILTGSNEGSSAVRLLRNPVVRLLQTGIEIVLGIIINLPIPIYNIFVRLLADNAPGLPSIWGCYLRALYYKPRLKRMGKNVIIEQRAVFSYPREVELSDFSYIDKNVIIASKTAMVGKRVHIAPFCIITGGGDFVIEDYACISNHSSVITSTETLKSGTRSSGPMIPSFQRDVLRGSVHIKKDAFIGTKATILTNVVVEEGSVVGAGLVLTKNTEPWGVYVLEGGRAKMIRSRERLDLDDI